MKPIGLQSSLVGKTASFQGQQKRKKVFFSIMVPKNKGLIFSLLLRYVTQGAACIIFWKLLFTSCFTCVLTYHKQTFKAFCFLSCQFSNFLWKILSIIIENSVLPGVPEKYHMVWLYSKMKLIHAIKFIRSHLFNTNNGARNYDILLQNWFILTNQ